MLHNEQHHLHVRMRKLSHGLVALEEYRQLAVNGLSKQASQIVANDVLRIAKMIGTENVALEQHTEFQSRLKYATGLEDASSIGKTISDAISRFVEWLKKAYKLARDQIGALLTSFDALRTKVTTLRGAVKSIPDGKIEVHIPVKLAQQVMVQGDVKLSVNYDLLKQLATFGAVTYPEAVNEFYIDLTSIVKTFDPTNNADSMVDAVKQSLSPLNFTNVDNQTYPGNVMIVADESGYNYSIAEVEARIIENDITVDVRAPEEITEALNQIIKIIDIAETIDDSTSKIESTITNVIEATTGLEQKTKDSNEEQKGNANALINVVLSTAGNLDNSNASIIRYLGRVLAAHLRIIELEIKTATVSQRA